MYKNYKDKEKRIAYLREYHRKNIEKIKEYQREYYKKNREKIIILQKEYSKNNAEKIAKYIRKYMVNKIKTDPKFRINHCIRKAVWKSLKSNKKGRYWENLVGYKLQDLINHLEKQFKPGMTWGNQGKWHIDHIIPISLWKFESCADREFKQCWALCNLQSLWERDNKIKYNKVNFND